MSPSPTSFSLAIVGSGPSTVYFLKHLLDNVARLEPRPARISIFEKSHIMGVGMPYSPETTDIHHLSNISSAELPELVQTFAEWLRNQSPAALDELGVNVPVDEREVYPRLALGRYLQAQYQALVSGLRDVGMEVHEFSGCPIVDIRRGPANEGLTVVTERGAEHHFRCAVLATGHQWPQEDEPDRRRYASPWPIHKLLPEHGHAFNFPIGLLGASLSAFDVVASLAHHHGDFLREEAGNLRYEPHPATEGFRIVMHSSHGLLPHLQFAQEEDRREIYRHISREDLLALVNAKGFLRLDRYFDKVCRPTLAQAFRKDGMPEMVTLLSEMNFRLRDFIEKMTDRHDYSEAFQVMRDEMTEARDSVLNDRPVYWKEYLDDLIYTLNFHAHLLPAEDHLFFGKELSPFLANVFAALPLASGEKILALHDAGKLELRSGNVEIAEEQPRGDRTRITITEGKEETVIDYQMFIDCGGQKALEMGDYPFPSLVRCGGVRRAHAAFAEERAAEEAVPEDKREKITTDEEGRAAYFIGGLDIDPCYRIIDAGGKPDTRLHEISFPLTSGLRPYSYGLQACNETARLVVEAWIFPVRREDGKGNF